MANDAFRRGMMLSLALHGVTPEEFGRVLLEKQAGMRGETVKQAGGGISTLVDVGGMGDAVKGITSFVLQWPLTAAALIGIPAGLGLGAMHHFATRPNYSRKVDDFKNDQLLRELRFQIDKAKDLEARRKGRRFLQLEVE
jgi:hypothetical protein